MVEEKRTMCKSYKPASTLQEINLERRLLNHIIKHISDRCDYLIEDGLLELLSPFTANDQLVIRLDNVFQVTQYNIVYFVYFNFITLYTHTGYLRCLRKNYAKVCFTSRNKRKMLYKYIRLILKI